MHIAAIILGALGSVFYYIYVIRQTGEAASKAVDAAQSFRGKMRRNAFRKKAEGSVLTAVDDPATAAAVMLCCVALSKGFITDNTRTALVNQVRREMQMPDAPEIVDFAIWIAKQVADPADVIRTYKGLWTANLASEHLARFIEMAREIADLNGSATAEQNAIIGKLQNQLLK
ncbi:MAG: hypothetical protein QNJ29_02980 [Rhizobiaceae bacterium]|nr:hypothetical protein [Rhizobiaceae bacterium]